MVTEDDKALTAAPGIGKKIAQRVILELKDKLAGEDAMGASSGKGGAAIAAAVPHSKSERSADGAGGAGLRQRGDRRRVLKDIDMDALPLEDIIRQALKKMMQVREGRT